MSTVNRKNGRRLVAVSISTLAVQAGWGAEPSYEAMRKRIDELEAKIQHVEARNVAESRDRPATIESVLADARARSQLLANGSSVHAGYDNGFFIQSEGGSFLLRPAINAQFRNVTASRGGVAGDPDESDLQNGFEWRRLRFRFDGHIFSRDLSYSFVWDTNRQGGGVTLLDAWAQYQFVDDWALKLGQFKASIFQERNLSGFAQLAVDRSLVDALIAGSLIDRVQGVGVIYGGSADKPLRAELAFHDGAKSLNTNFQDTLDTSVPPDGIDDRPDWGVSGRVEWKAAGDWKSYRDFSAIGNKQDLVVLAMGGNVDGAPRANNYFGTVDAQWENGNGLSAFGGLFTRYRDRRDAESFTDWGGLAQVGYLVAPAWELFGRYDVTIFDEDSVAAGAEDTFNEITVGVNRYLGRDGSSKHRAKVTVDLSYLPDGAPSNVDSLGILATEEDEWVLRAQFQLII